MSTQVRGVAGRVRASEAAAWALSHGRVAMTRDELADLLGVPADQVRRRLLAPTRRGEWVSPARGLWVPVPPQYLTWGAPPALEFIDALMRHLGTPYYVGWLTAASIYGASHHAPQVTQVAVAKSIAARRAGRNRIEFYLRSGLGAIPTAPRRTRSGDVPVSTPEATALDLADDTSAAGGIDNVGNVIVGLVEETGLDDAALAAAAGLFPAAAARRVGWIAEHHTDSGSLPLLRQVAHRQPSPSKLAPFEPAREHLDREWNLYINHEMDIDA